ncbi:STAS/SEC14 domain-containing protein [Marinicella pacifica]|uniref:STAS/SEC14 domain-containing protein n=1 Tax=Marinicella pacifica TaxID=1171543 RepID=A0A917CI15_9GAMM|nr:STAS/SEC14 domain-containing protein [Marinicella pacifica]GGF89061.1 STAS/SEC14 domain-containing protein [Marinicella pacifica]
MGIKRHGLSIGIEQFNNEFLLTIKALGKLTHEDYQVITPMIESALAGIEEPRIKVLFDGRQMEGWELRAAWDDFKLGLKYRGEFTKVAIIGNQKWQKLAAKVGGWFVSGDVKHFQDLDTAYNWLQR